LISLELAGSGWTRKGAIAGAGWDDTLSTPSPENPAHLAHLSFAKDFEKISGTDPAHVPDETAHFVARDK